VSAYPDTSFLYAIYRKQVNSPQAAAFFQKMREPLTASTLLLYEFRQSVRFQGYLFGQDHRQGFSWKLGATILKTLQADLAAGVLVVASVDWSDVQNIAERLSSQYTLAGGHRALDILHVATALHLGADEFLTFDQNQRTLAVAEGLKVPL
jgi:predicted nucleic acid-binding protein